ncbi:MAG TPA: DUF3575 domain-containing protein [Flavobacteriales bacterium]|nr:DUF3575 domain-containing protein [Flavobacteriales bacterium]
MYRKIALALLLAGTVSLGHAQKNITKTNILFGPLYRTAHVGQERLLFGKISVNTIVKIMAPLTVPKILTNKFEVDGLEENPFLSSKLTAIGNITQFRYYRKENMRGLYIGVFGQYMQYKVESGTFKGTFHDEFNVEYKADLKQVFKYGLGGGGMLVGVQGIIKNHFVIDWTILSLGFGMGKLSGGIEASNTSANFDFRNYTEDINKYTYGLEDSKFLPVKKDVGQYNMELSAKAPFPIIHTTLNIGFAYGGGGPKAPKVPGQ